MFFFYNKIIVLCKCSQDKVKMHPCQWLIPPFLAHVHAWRTQHWLFFWRLRFNKSLVGSLRWFRLIFVAFPIHGFKTLELSYLLCVVALYSIIINIFTLGVMTTSLITKHLPFHEALVLAQF